MVCDMTVLPAEKVVVGANAARIHRLDLERDYKEIAVPPSSGVRSRRGLLVRNVSFPADDIVSIDMALHLRLLRREATAAAGWARRACRVADGNAPALAIDLSAPTPARGAGGAS